MSGGGEALASTRSLSRSLANERKEVRVHVWIDREEAAVDELLEKTTGNAFYLRTVERVLPLAVWRMTGEWGTTVIGPGHAVVEDWPLGEQGE
jgi:hypothetical protein